MKSLRGAFAGLISAALAFAPLLAPVAARAADNVAVTPGTGKTMACKDITAVCYPEHLIVDHLGNVIDPATSGNQTTANTSLGSIDTKLSSQATAANQSTANTSLGSIDTKLTGVASAADQATANTSLGSIDTKLSSQATAANQSTANTSLGSIDTKLSSQATAANQSTANTSLGSIDTKLSSQATAANQTTANTKLDTLHSDLTAATPAGENHTGEVGSNETTVQVAQTVTASSAYAAGNAIGGLMTITNAARVSAGSGLIESVVVNAKSAQTTQIDVVIFSANPSGSTCTDKTAFSVAAADFDKSLGVVHVADWTSLGTPSIGQAQAQAIAFALASGTSLYACAVTRSTPTFTATTDISIGFRIIRN